MTSRYRQHGNADVGLELIGTDGQARQISEHFEDLANGATPWIGAAVGGASVTPYGLDGAVARAISHFMGDFVHVRSYGALCDGSGDTVAEWLAGGDHDRGYADLAAITADYPHVDALTWTIDAAALQQAIDKSPDQGWTVRLGAQLTLGDAQINLPSDDFRRIRIEGGPTYLTFTGDKAWSIVGCSQPYGPRHEFHGITVASLSSTADPWARSGTAWYLEDSGGQVFENCLHLYCKYGWHQHNNTRWCEGNKYINCEGRHYEACWYFDKETGASASMADTQWVKCKVTSAEEAAALADPDVANYGMYIGTGISIYSAGFFNLRIFPQRKKAIGIYCDGILRNAHGSIGIEGDTDTGSIAVQFGANANLLVADLFFDIRSMGALVDASLITEKFDVQTTSVNGALVEHIVKGSLLHTIRSYLKAADSSIVYQERLDSSGNVLLQVASGTELRLQDTTGAIGTTVLRGIVVGSRQTTTATTAGVINVAGIGSLTLSLSSAENVTGLSGGKQDQEVTIQHTTTNATMKHGANLRLNGSVDYAGAVNAMQTFKCMNTGGTQWFEKARIVP